MTSGVPKLNQTNFEVWIVLIEALLTRKGLEGVALGEVEKPLTGPNSKGVRDWERKNKEARAEIILHVEEDQISHCVSLVASEVIEELTRVHRARGLATRLTLRRRFLTMKKKIDQPMSQWIAEVRTLAHRLRGIGVTVDDEDIILALTMGLPRSYEAFIVTLDSTPVDDLDLHAVISRLLNEESRHVAVAAAEEGEIEEPTAAVAVLKRTKLPNPGDAAANLSRITCYNCANKGHYQANCPYPRTEVAKAAIVPVAASAVAAAYPRTGAKIVEVIEEGW